jgi:hypothetical protein
MAADGAGIGGWLRLSAGTSSGGIPGDGGGAEAWR